MPPTTPNSRLSDSNCRNSRSRPAPRAARTAYSRARAEVRATIRPAMLEHAISSTKPTAANRSSTAALLSAAESSVKCTREMLQLLFFAMAAPGVPEL